jgi:hypothetical protein
VGVVRAIRQPNEWPGAQRAFRAGYLSDPDAAIRQQVHVRWWFNRGPGPSLVGFVVSLHRWWRGQEVVEGTQVAVYAPTAKPPARPVIVFPVADDAFDEPAGTSDATIIGEVGLNGVCCLELPDGRLVWPTHNPVVPTSSPAPAP